MVRRQPVIQVVQLLVMALHIMEIISIGGSFQPASQFSLFSLKYSIHFPPTSLQRIPHFENLSF